jgi:hypothetical protein
MNQNMASVAAPMPIVAVQPVMRRRAGMMKLPMIFGFTAMTMMFHVRDGKTTPLITALQSVADAERCPRRSRLAF